MNDVHLEGFQREAYYPLSFPYTVGFHRHNHHQQPQIKVPRSWRFSLMTASSESTPHPPTDPSFWPPRNSQKEFDWDIPTYVAYAVHNPRLFASKFENARAKLDYSYHRNPTLTRQEYQDVVLSRILEADTSASSSFPSSSSALSSSSSSISSTSHSNDHDQQQQPGQPQPQRRRPIIVFSAGPMGVGKSYVLSQLHQRSLFPLSKFIKIDPDMLKNELPEIAGYLRHDSESAATKLHRESTQMADVLFEHALEVNRNILVDGSLRDVDWYTTLLGRLRREFPHYRLAILYVSASPEIIRGRARRRAEATGRAVPEDLLQASIDQVPRSVESLSHLTDYTFEISNNDDEPMALKQWSTALAQSDDNDCLPPKEISWGEFQQVWETDTEESGLPEGHRDHIARSSICQQIQSLSISSYLCPVQQERECKSATEIWSRAYPSFCPRCTIWADQQCKTVVILVLLQ
jgi:Zeta toxin